MHINSETWCVFSLWSWKHISFLHVLCLGPYKSRNKTASYPFCACPKGPILDFSWSKYPSREKKGIRDEGIETRETCPKGNFANISRLLVFWADFVPRNMHACFGDFSGYETSNRRNNGEVTRQLLDTYTSVRVWIYCLVNSTICKNTHHISEFISN